jgi:hypothetical protein
MIVVPAIMIPLLGQRSCNAVATANKFPESNDATRHVVAVAYPSPIAITGEFPSFGNPSIEFAAPHDVEPTVFTGILCKPFCPVLFNELDRPQLSLHVVARH